MLQPTLVQRLNLAAQNNQDIKDLLNLVDRQQEHTEHAILMLNAIPRTHVGNLDSYKLANELTVLHDTLRVLGFR